MSKSSFFSICLMAFSFFSFTFMAKTKRVIFFGDSITQAAVDPGGYISLMGDLLKDKGDSSNYELLGAGISGNKVYDLYLRLETDVLDKKPDVVFIFVGINDIWHKKMGTGTDEDKYVRFYEALIKKMQAQKIEVILVTPPCIGERHDFTNPQDGDLNLYSSFIRQLAQKYGCKLADLREAFLKYEIKENKENKWEGILTTDGVHLNDKGNRLVAETFLAQLQN